LLCETVDVRTFSAVLDHDFCSRHPAIQPGSYAVLSIGRFASATSAEKVISDASFAVMQPGDTAAMGLSAVEAILAQCGGFLVRTTGSREPDDRRRDSGFHVFLPSGAFLASAVFLPPGVAQSIPLARAADGAAGETILLVEDEPLVRELSRDMLERQGYRVILAANAGEAEQISGSAGSFDLLITDAMMPTISGAELARRLRADHPGLKVLYISGYADNEVGSDDPGSERAAFLQKPFSADSLGRKIRQMLNRG
jgi:CheY-like chemotaxis protein